MARERQSPSEAAAPAAEAAGPARILIVDDHPIVRRGLAQLISEDPAFVACGEAADDAEAMKALGQSKPHLVIVDLSLGSGSGLDLIKRIRAADPRIKVLVCTMHEERIYGERSIRAGANGYLNKEEAAESIVGALHRVLDGKMHVSAELAERLLVRRLRKPEGGSASPAEALSDRELEIFELIGHGLSSRRIAAKLGISAKTVESHREHMKRKLGAAENAELVHRAVEWVMRSGEG